MLFTVPKMLDEALEFLENRSKKDATFQYEVIIVSDGSKDSTVQLAHGYSKRYTAEKVRVLDLIKNRGKGGAVRMVRKEAKSISAKLVEPIPFTFEFIPSKKKKKNNNENFFNFREC